jgi:hypothetical protein
MIDIVKRPQYRSQLIARQVIAFNFPVLNYQGLWLEQDCTIPLIVYVSGEKILMIR